MTILEKTRLDGRVAIVTGASKGIGEAIARGLADLGAKVVVSSRKQEAVEAVAASICRNGGEAIAIAAHVGDMEQATSLVDRTAERFGAIDVIVNNAAANPVFGSVLDADRAVFDKIMAVNVRGPLAIARRAFPFLKQGGGGSIVNISSIGGVRPEPHLGLYSISKAALISLTKVLASEWGPANVRVNAICPGLVKTKFSQALWDNPDILERFIDETPLRRLATPDDIAPLAVFLAGEAAAYCTGGVYMIDGGYTI